MPAPNDSVKPSATKSTASPAKDETPKPATSRRPALVPVLLSQKHGKYNAGETAGFLPDEAQRIVDAEAGTFVKPKK